LPFPAKIPYLYKNLQMQLNPQGLAFFLGKKCKKRASNPVGVGMGAHQLQLKPKRPEACG
jgi:hypothetical protein